MEAAADLYWAHNDTPTVWTQILREIDAKYKLDIELQLTEPAFFLPEATANRPVVLRGRCTLIVKRPVKIKEVVVTLDGFRYVRWRPNWSRDVGSIVNCPLTLFNSKKDSKAQFQFQAKEPKKPTTSVTEAEVPQKKFKTLRKVVDKLHLHPQRTEKFENPTTSVTEVEVPQKKFKTLRKVVDKLHLHPQRTEKFENPTTSVTEVEVSQKNFKTLRKVVDKFHMRPKRTEPDVESKCFSPGKYSYDFEMLLHSGLPESTFVDGAVIRYHLKASVKCHSRLRGMYKRTEIPAVRCPADAYVEDSVGGHYSLPLPGIMDLQFTLPQKGIALEDSLPVLCQIRTHKNTKLHKFVVYLVEDVRYYSRDGANTGRAPSKKIFLYRAGGRDLRPDVRREQELQSPELDPDILEAKLTSLPTSSGICSTPDVEAARETFDFNIDLPMPKCKSHRDGPGRKYMHSDVKLPCLEVGHSLEFQTWVFLHNKRTPQEFTHRVPLTVRSCYAHTGSTILPAYFEERLPVYSSSLDASMSTIDHEH